MGADNGHPIRSQGLFGIPPLGERAVQCQLMNRRSRVKRPAEDGSTPVEPGAAPAGDNPPPPPAHSYGSWDVQPGYESQGYTKPEPWGKDPWADDD
jgi:hypothetical protein